MDSIEVKSIGTLIDELITTNLKCFVAQDKFKDAEKNCDAKAAIEEASKAQELNARRNRLIRAIDRRMGETDISPTGKTYG